MIEAMFVEGIEKLEVVQWVKFQVLGKDRHVNPLYEVLLAKDHLWEHVLVYEDNKPIATGSMVSMSNRYEILEICVLKEQQRMGYGDLVIKMLIDKAFKMGAKEVWTLPNEQCGQLFEKIGFVVDIETNHLFIRQNMIKKCKR